MHFKTLATAVCLMGATAMQAIASSGIPAPRPRLGAVSSNGVVSFEDVHLLTPAVASALVLLRTERFEEAEAAFQGLRRTHPQEALAYEGEIEASERLGRLEATVSSYRSLLMEAATSPREQKAVIHWALGQVVMFRNGYYPRFIGDNPGILGDEPREQFAEALRINPALLVAHLSLAAYYEYRSQEKGSLARREYEAALHLRPDLYQIRYLHALTWTRPGYVPPEEEAREKALGFPPTEDNMMMPEKAIEECLGLIRDHPDYSPPYYTVGDKYLWPIGDKVKAKQYLSKYIEIGNKSTEAWKRAKSLVDAMD